MATTSNRPRRIAVLARAVAEGFRLTAIGGSDTHDVTSKNVLPPPGRIGVPTTVVFAATLSAQGVLDGIRAGRVFVDVAGSRNAAIDFSADTPGGVVQMGGTSALARGEQARFTVRVSNLAGGSIEVIRHSGNPSPIADARIASDAHEARFTIDGDGARGWVRVNVRDASGKLAVIGNPIYLNWAR